MSNDWQIELSAIGRIFDVGGEQVHALRDIDLNIGAGEYLSLMGPSGSGKSTLLHLLGLLDRPTRGVYRFNGRDTTNLSDIEQAHIRSQEIGFIFQFFNLIPRLTASENIELPLMLQGVPRRDRQKRVAEALAETDLMGRRQHRPDQLSGGQRQRVAIARAMITEPRLLLADEPTGNLDSTSGGAVIEVLEALNARGITLIVVTHDQAIGGRATRRLRLVDGRIDEDLKVAA